MTLRPRRLIMWSCVVWVLTMAVLVFSGSIWASYERRLAITERPEVPPPTIHDPQTSEPVKPGTRIEQLADSAARLCGVDPNEFWSLILRESGGRQWDKHGRVLRSSAGALGIAQVKVSTARDVSFDLDIRNPWDNALAGACYYRKMLDRFVDPKLALIAYHRGPNAVGPAPSASVAYADGIIGGSTR